LYSTVNSNIVTGRMCNYSILLPTTADPNDYIFFKMLYIKGGTATLFTGASLAKATRKYTLSSGQSFTG